MSHRVQAASARKDFAQLVDRSALGERIKVTRYNKTLAVLVPKEDLAKLEDCERSRARKPRKSAAERVK